MLARWRLSQDRPTQSEELQEPDPFPDWLEQQSSNKEMLLLQVTVFQSVRNIDYRPFKALVVGSSPTQPNFYFSALAPRERKLIKQPRSCESRRHFLDALPNFSFPSYSTETSPGGGPGSPNKKPCAKSTPISRSFPNVVSISTNSAMLLILNRCAMSFIISTKIHLR